LWTDQLDPRYSAFDAEKKLRQTKAFLEETCKDLLVIHEHKDRHNHSYNVEFIHRTAFDFLCDNPAGLPIEKHHFSDESFAMDLLKLRCICRLREILMFNQDTTDLEIHQPWLLACESTVLEIYRTGCNCLGLRHLSYFWFARACAIQGLHKYLLETAQDMPHVAVSQCDRHPGNYLALATLALQETDTREATAMLLLNQALGFGCDPNVSFATYQVRNNCGQTTWEHWLHEQYLYSQRRHSRAARRGDGAHQSIDAAQDIACQRIQENVSIINSFLRHGAAHLAQHITI
jgi:hypothetical protein